MEDSRFPKVVMFGEDSHKMVVVGKLARGKHPEYYVGVSCDLPHFGLTSTCISF